MNYRNAKFCRDGIRIDCEIEHPVYGWIPFTCDPKDTGAQFNVQDLHQLMKGSGKVKSMTQAEINAEVAAEVRGMRDSKLVADVDPIATNALRWAALTAEEQQALADYRQALLDVPQQAGFPSSITWPELS
jgi:acetamidase/formamidase